MLPETQAYQAEATANLFVTLDGREDFGGLIVQLPDGWRLDDAVALRYGSERVPVAVRQSSEGQVIVTARQPLRGPHDIVLRVQVGASPGIVEWSAVPFIRQMGDRVPIESYRVTHRVEVEQTAVSRASQEAVNWALAFSESSTPLLLRRDALPSLGAEADVTVEFWLKTTGLDEVVLSTWSGREQRAYPLEFVIDKSGRLRYYCGRPGQHQSLMTPRPIADGRWHHVALTHTSGEGRLQLLLEGTPVDSMRNVQLPDDPMGTTLALGGRPAETHGASPDNERPAFTGWIDELRLWPEARDPETVREMSRRTLNAGTDERHASLSFDREVPADLIAGEGTGVRRAPSDLRFQVPIRALRASIRDQGGVRLTWEAVSANAEGFIVERSLDGRAFEPVDRVAPQAARQQASGEIAHYEYVDATVSEQVLFYRVRQRFEDGTERISGTLKIGLGTESSVDVRLIGNFPNPFSEATTVAYEVLERQEVNVSVWDLSGQRVAQIASGTHAPGYYEEPFQAGNLPSGTYFVRVQTPSRMETRKMVLLK